MKKSMNVMKYSLLVIATLFHIESGAEVNETNAMLWLAIFIGFLTSDLNFKNK